MRRSKMLHLLGQVAKHKEVHRLGAPRGMKGPDASRVRFYFVEKDEFLYLLKGAPAVPTARSNRCFAVATRTLLRLSRCESSSLRSSGNLTATRQVHFSRLDNKPSSAYLASAETTGCVRGASYGCESRPRRSAASHTLGLLASLWVASPLARRIPGHLLKRHHI
jgi:hypothetical protein